MPFKCQHCGHEFRDEEVMDELGLKEGDELVAHRINEKGELGVLTDYYCGPDCFIAELD